LNLKRKGSQPEFVNGPKLKKTGPGAKLNRNAPPGRQVRFLPPMVADWMANAFAGGRDGTSFAA
jgi:hypothetical protein